MGEPSPSWHSQSLPPRKSPSQQSTVNSMTLSKPTILPDLLSHSLATTTVLISRPASSHLPSSPHMCTAANAFATKDNQQVLAGIKMVRADLSEFSTSLAGCPDMWADFQVVKNWYYYWEQQGEMKVYQSAYQNVIHNMPAIKASASKIDDDRHANNFVAVGEDAGTIAKLALPVAAAEEYLQ